MKDCTKSVRAHQGKPLASSVHGPRLGVTNPSGDLEERGSWREKDKETRNRNGWSKMSSGTWRLRWSMKSQHPQDSLEVPAADVPAGASWAFQPKEKEKRVL